MNFMGIFDFWFKKHGHKKSKEIQELLEEIKRMEQKEFIMVQNEAKILSDNKQLRKEVERLERWLYRCRHPRKTSVTFDVVFP